MTVLAIWAATPAPARASASLQFGAFTPGDPYGGSVAATDALESALGRRVEIVNWYQNWGGGDWISSVQEHVVRAVTNSGRTPLLTWEPWDPAGGAEQPQYSLARIAGGVFDAYIARWADGLKAIGATIYLRPMHEMNGNWYPWSGTVNANSPELYVRAWRRMHDIFGARGASNVRWVWSPNTTDVPQTPANAMESYYPGAAYVDVLAVDGYNWGAEMPQYGGWQSFAQVFAAALDRVGKLGPQPLWIAEIGSDFRGGDKAAWIKDALAHATANERLQALVWFNADKERDWRAAPSADVAAAFTPGNEAFAAAAAALDPAAPEAPAGARTAPAPEAPPRGSAVAPAPRLQVTVAKRPRAGRPAILRWRATGAAGVTRWTVAVNGKLVRTVRGGAGRSLKLRIARAGRHRATVTGYDAAAARVVTGARSFRATR